MTVTVQKKDKVQSSKAGQRKDKVQSSKAKIAERSSQQPVSDCYTCTVLHPKTVDCAVFHSGWIFSVILHTNQTHNDPQSLLINLIIRHVTVT